MSVCDIPANDSIQFPACRHHEEPDSDRRYRRYPLFSEEYVQYDTDVKENEQKCPIHAENIVIPVEVERAEIEVLSTSKNIFEGSTFTYNAPDCDEKCDYHDLCFPDGLIENDKCIVLENNGKHKEACKKGLKLNKLTLGFVI